MGRMVGGEFRTGAQVRPCRALWAPEGRLKWGWEGLKIPEGRLNEFMDKALSTASDFLSLLLSAPGGLLLLRTFHHVLELLKDTLGPVLVLGRGL